MYRLNSQYVHAQHSFRCVHGNLVEVYLTCCGCKSHFDRVYVWVCFGLSLLTTREQSHWGKGLCGGVRSWGRVYEGPGKQVAVMHGSKEDSPFFTAPHKIIINHLGAAYICPFTHLYKCQCVIEMCFFISQLPLKHPWGVGSRPRSPLNSDPGAIRVTVTYFFFQLVSSGIQSSNLSVTRPNAQPRGYLAPKLALYQDSLIMSQTRLWQKRERKGERG